MSDGASRSPDLSVVIAARDVAPTIDAQLSALTAQEWDHSWEVLVVDNQSTDETAAIVEEWAAKYGFIRLVEAPERPGQSYARNVGFQLARSENVAVCDADDVVAPGWVAAMGNALFEHEFVAGPLELDQLNPPWLAGSRGRSLERQLATFHGIFPYASGCNFGLRRSWWERAGGFDETFPPTEDMELSLRLWRLGVRLQFVPGAVVHYRYRQGPRALWRQGRAYGSNRPRLCRRLRDLGVKPPSRLAGWRSWVWLVVHLPSVRTAQGRAVWVWVAANRLGQVEGSIRHRTVYL